jgi:hypothetical protein
MVLSAQRCPYRVSDPLSTTRPAGMAATPISLASRRMPSFGRNLLQRVGCAASIVRVSVPWRVGFHLGVSSQGAKRQVRSQDSLRRGAIKKGRD